MHDTVHDIIKSEFQLRVVDESLQRILQCLDTLSHEQLWHRANPNTNPVGNLVLHLCGNIRQYILSGVGGAEDTRQRPEEFADGHDHTKEDLAERITQTLHDANAVVLGLAYEQLTQTVNIQGFSHTRLSAILHVVEHLSYHVGQITYYTKLSCDVDTAYYGGMDLDVTG